MRRQRGGGEGEGWKEQMAGWMEGWLGKEDRWKKYGNERARMRSREAERERRGRMDESKAEDVKLGLDEKRMDGGAEGEGEGVISHGDMDGGMKRKSERGGGIRDGGRRGQKLPQDCRYHWGRDIFSSAGGLVSPNAECLLLLYLECYTTRVASSANIVLFARIFPCLIFIFFFCGSLCPSQAEAGNQSSSVIKRRWNEKKNCLRVGVVIWLCVVCALSMRGFYLPSCSCSDFCFTTMSKLNWTKPN